MFVCSFDETYRQSQINPSAPEFEPTTFRVKNCKI